MNDVNGVTDLSVQDGIAVVTVNSPPVNALSARVRDGVYGAIGAAVADPAVKAIVLICAGKTFMAGGDINEFGKPLEGVAFLTVLDRIENAPKPVVAAIHGTALGGGLEVALACHFRVAVPSARCGSPEVHLGMLPGGSGTQRLPRVIGPEAAMEMMITGRQMSAGECANLGMIDLLAPEGELRAAAVAFAKGILADGRPLRKTRDLVDKVAAARGRPEIFAEFRRANAERLRGFLAPEYIIRCVEAAVNLPFDEGLKVEQAFSDELMYGAQSAALRDVFFAERQIWKIPDVPPSIEVRQVAQVAIVGAGELGGDIASSLLDSGLPVTMVGDPEALDHCLARIRRDYEGLSSSEVTARMSLLKCSPDLAALKGADLIIEVVADDLQSKKQVFTQLDALAGADTILATSTSYLDVDAIAAVTRRPEAVIGMHFFTRTGDLRLLEVVRAAHTAKPVIATVMKLARKLGKIAALVGSFVGNRMLSRLLLQAQHLLLEGSTPWEVDRVLYDFGFPLGPFALADHVGLDIGWLRELPQGPGIHELLCERGRCGQKTNAGFYDYEANGRAQPSKQVEALILEMAPSKGSRRRSIGAEEILERCVYPMVNEGARILEAGKAIRASDIDIVGIHGLGWPAYRGGPMYFGDLAGLDVVLRKLRHLESRLGEAQPAALLERLVAQGAKFRDL